MLLRAIRRAFPCLLLLAVVGAPGREARAQGQYTYDPSGNVVTVGTDSYVYDRFGRVQRGTAGTGKAQAYTYDRYGNIETITTTVNLVDSVRLLGVNPSSNRLSATPSGSGSAIYGEYDDAGRMTRLFSIGGFFDYDGADSVSQSIVDGHRKIHLYTADDERIATIDTSTGDRHWTVRDGAARVLRRMTRRADGSWLWDEDYVYRGASQLAALVPGDARHFHLDHLGSSRLVTGAGGAALEEHRYYAFGEEATVFASTDDAKKFTGHERDDPSLDYMHARYYGPKMGRFLSVDPGRDWDPKTPQSFNLYAYTRNNPINGTDPNGRWTFSFGISFNGAAIFGAGGNKHAIAVDDDGNVAITRSWNGGSSLVVTGLHKSASVSLDWNPVNDTIQDLNSEGLQIGGGGHYVWGANVDVGLDPLKGVTGLGVSFGTGAGAEFHIVGEKTTVIWSLGHEEIQQAATDAGKLLNKALTLALDQVAPAPPQATPSPGPDTPPDYDPWAFSHH